MTPAEHAALSAQVARAIGYEQIKQISVQACDDLALVYGRWDDCRPDWPSWREFDYRDPSVALPLLEWLMREHGASVFTYACIRIKTDRTLCGIEFHDGVTLTEAIARAVIAVADAKRQQVEQNEAREVLQA